MIGACRTTMKNDRQVAVFARAPILGKVKTRLAQDLGAEEALRIYTQLLRGTVRRLAALNCPKALYVDGSGLEQLAATHGFEVRPQTGTGLGARMASAIDECLEISCAAALVGVDIPLLDAGYVESAFERLKTCDLVLGPTEDGGYCLIAMKQSAPDLFEAMPWGGREVCARTVAKAEALGLSVGQLRVLWDIDRRSDLERLRL